MRSASPLRYPGGKWRIYPFLRDLLALNSFTGYEYVEAYAGGASLALSLLFDKKVTRIHLNDLNPAIYWFWWAVLFRTDDLVRFVGAVPLNVGEWNRQKEIYARGLDSDVFALGCAVFYLNRTSHSGIMNGGVIGGKSQQGRWKIDARFNRVELQRRIEKIGGYRDHICIYRQDALEFLRARPFAAKAFVYLDPPYLRAGSSLYLNSYDADAHQGIRSFVSSLKVPWMVSYDDVPEVRRLYRGVPSRRLSLLHTARAARMGHEVIFFSEDIKIPRLFSSSRSKRS